MTSITPEDLAADIAWLRAEGNARWYDQAEERAYSNRMNRIADALATITSLSRELEEARKECRAAAAYNAHADANYQELEASLTQAQAAVEQMREACAVLSETRYADPAWEPLCRSAGRSIAAAIRDLPLPNWSSPPSGSSTT